MPPHPSGHRWKIFCQLIFRTYGDICHICGHGGAKQVDHLEPVAEHPELAWTLANARPAHGSRGNPCVQCSAAASQEIFCNQLRGALSVERARRIIAARIAAHAGKRASPPVRETPADSGREW